MNCIKYFSLIMIFLLSACGKDGGNAPSVDYFELYSNSNLLASEEGGNKPYPGTEIVFKPNLMISGSRNETVGTIIQLKTSSCVSLESQNNGAVQVSFFRMIPIQLKYPSYGGAPTGMYYDPLVSIQGQICPAQNGQEERIWIWTDISIPKGLEPGNHQFSIKAGDGFAPLTVSAKVWKMTMPDFPSLPIYTEVAPWNVVRGHFGQGNDQQEPVLGLQYIQELSAHRVYPFKNYISLLNMDGNGNVDLDSGGAGSFRNMVINSVPSSAYIFMPVFEDNPATVTPQFLQAIDKAIVANGLQGRAISYLKDEPTSGELNAVLNTVNTVKQNAPHLKTLVTMEYNSSFQNRLDIFAPLMDHFDVPDRQPASAYSGVDFWLYISCVSHGCGPELGTGDPGDSDGAPDLVVDRPSVYVRSFGWVGQKTGTRALLYYNALQSYARYVDGIDVWDDIYLFSGNGDGTLMYPGRPGEYGLTEHRPISSIRVKLLRESSFDVEYLKMAQAINPGLYAERIGSLIRQTVDWDQDYKKYQTVRDEFGEMLNK